MKVELCLGSSCHVKGARNIYLMLKEALERDGLTDRIELVGSLCLGACKTSSGANVKVDDDIVKGITADNFEQFYQTRIKSNI